MAATGDAVQDHVRATHGKRVLAAELGVEVAQPIGITISLVGDLVVQRGIGIADVLHGEPGRPRRASASRS